MKKHFGIIGLSALVIVGPLMTVGCSGDSSEGTPPAAATTAPPADPGGKGNGSTPGQAKSGLTLPKANTK